MFLSLETSAGLAEGSPVAQAQRITPSFASSP